MVQTRSATLGRSKPDETLQKCMTDGPRPTPKTSIPAKRSARSGATASKKRRRGNPGELCQLNLDVLFLIAAYIHPMDLLNLARTCRSLRELLMDKSSEFIWKAARMQVKALPECPADLTEPEFANLSFCPRCLNCGKYTTTVFWNMRRRYCPSCRIRQLRRLSTCAEVVRNNKTVVPVEHIVVKEEYNTWCDRGQVASFMRGYQEAFDKRQFISDKQKECRAIHEHANKCEAWYAVMQAEKAEERKADRERRRVERCERVFELLEQHGYLPEIMYAGHFRIERCRQADFETSKALTNKEWGQIWPEWHQVMDTIRSQRIEEKVFQPRLRLLISKYDNYVMHRSPDTPEVDLLPHLFALAGFGPFRDALEAPEGTEIEGLFASAFSQLPVLAAKWSQNLGNELAGLVQIPSELSSSNMSNGRRGRHVELSETDMDKLDLACALFWGNVHAGVCPYPQVPLICTPRNIQMTGKSVRAHPEPMLDQLRIHFLAEAPYIVHVCGLDPHVARMEDMDQRNARLKCVGCSSSPSTVYDWRSAMCHARLYHQHCDMKPLSESTRRQLVDDQYIDAIQTAEQSIEQNQYGDFDPMQCLLCRSRVGGVHRKQTFVHHLGTCHQLAMKMDDLKRGVHYAPVGIIDSRAESVKLVEESGKVQFKVSQRRVFILR